MAPLRGLRWDVQKTKPAGPRYDVHLNVYDIQTPDDPELVPRLNDCLAPFGLGVYHSAIEVHGIEYAFGGHTEATSGIFEVTPRECAGVKFRVSHHLGTTTLSKRAVTDLATSLGAGPFLGTTYSLISHNCNHFTRCFAKELGVISKFPAWPNRLANLAVAVSCLLPEGVDRPIGDAAPTANGANAAGSLIEEPRKPPPVATL